MRPQLVICALLNSSELAQSLIQFLNQGRYFVNHFYSSSEFLQCIKSQGQLIDCLILQSSPEFIHVLAQLSEQGILLPAVVLKPEPEGTLEQETTQVEPSPVTSVPKTDLDTDLSFADHQPFYHNAVVQMSSVQLSQIRTFVDRALTGFLTLLSPDSANPELTSDFLLTTTARAAKGEDFLMPQQQRLAEKLRERLGYLGVYYKRDPKHFLRHLDEAERREFLSQIRVDYHEIILNYFTEDSHFLNQKIDTFVDTVFLADVAVSKIVEIHMELMDEFSKQLKLEGRSEEILLDYRLTLIDIIAHLCEMYRRSIPRES